jgi:sec-independent protein translocase protein TatA
MPFGPLEIGIVLLIVLVVFGPKRLPDLGRSLGSGMREFKDSITGNSKDEDDGPSKLTAPAPTADEPDEAAKRPQS